MHPPIASGRPHVPRLGAATSEGKFEAYVRRFEAKPLIEPVCCDPGLVRRELNQLCATSAPFCDRPRDHRPSKAKGPKVGPDTYCFDLQPCSSASGQAGNECKLHGPNHFIFGRDNYEKKLRGVRINRLESKIVGIPVLDCNRVDRGSELVGSQQPNNRSHII